MRFVICFGLLALLCAVVTEAKATETKTGGLKRTVSSFLHLNKHKHKGDGGGEPVPQENAPPKLTRHATKASLHPTKEARESDPQEEQRPRLERTGTVKNLWNTLSRRGQSRPRPSVLPVFTKLISDGPGEIPPFLLAAWHAILLPERRALLEQGIFRESGSNKEVEDMQAAVNNHQMTTPAEYTKYKAKSIAVLLKQFLNSQHTDDGLTGLLGGYNEIFTGDREEYDPPLDEIVEKTHIDGTSQRAKVGRFYIKIARTVANYSASNKMEASNLAKVYPGLMQLDLRDPISTLAKFTRAEKVALKLIQELDHVEALPDPVPYPVPV